MDEGAGGKFIRGKVDYYANLMYVQLGCLMRKDVGIKRSKKFAQLYVDACYVPRSIADY